jgi:hypothetical protein
MPPLPSLSQMITWGIAVGALVVSIVSLFLNGKVQRRQVRFQAKQEELIELQLASLHRDVKAPAPASLADVRAELERRDGQHRFVLTNWGNGPAFDVAFTVDVPPGRTPVLVESDYREKIPVPEFAPGARCSLLAAVTHGTGTAFQAQWTWRNADGTNISRRSLLTL